jgi:hypothetical protein
MFAIKCLHVSTSSNQKEDLPPENALLKTNELQDKIFKG